MQSFGLDCKYFSKTVDCGLNLLKCRGSLAKDNGRTGTVGSQPLDQHPVTQICYGCDLIRGVQNGSDGQGRKGATAAALVAGEPFPRRRLAGEARNRCSSGRFVSDLALE